MVQERVTSGASAGTSATAGSLPMGRCEYQPIPADWVVHAKVPCKEFSGAGNYICSRAVEFAGKDGRFWTFAMTQTSAGDWLTIKAETGGSSGTGEGGSREGIRMLREMLKKYGHPLTVAQEKQFEDLQKEIYCPELIEAWEKVAAKPTDKPIAVDFIRAYQSAVTKYGAQIMDLGGKKMMDILIPAQAKALGAPAGGVVEAHGGATSSGPGSFAVSMLSDAGKVQMSVSIDGKRTADAFDSLVYSVNKSFKSTLSAPEIPADLAEQIVNVKIVIESADGALEKLAAAVGAKLESRDGKQHLVTSSK